MELLGRWTQDSRTDCDSIGLSVRGWLSVLPAILSPDRRFGVSLGLVLAIASVLAAATTPAGTPSTPTKDQTAPQKAPQPGVPGPTAPAGAITPEQVKAYLKSQGKQTEVPKPGEQETPEPNALEEQEAMKAEEKPAVTEPELSIVELLLSGQMPFEVSTSLRQFGYDVFSRPISTFAPVTNVPVGPDYVVGPGDGFTVTMWGRIDAQYPLVVDRDGQIVLPEVGALKIWGMKFSDLHGYLQHELSRKFTDFKMSVTMDRLRTIRVFVVGEASAPGGYTISSLSTAINALFAAGGPSKNGSLRTIRLLRNGAEPVQIDLYDFLLGGDKGTDVRLQDGDTIFIPLIGPVAGVAGNVKRPAIYEMVRPMKLQEVLDLAGGITFAGWLQRVQVERIVDHQKRTVVDFDLSEKTPAERREGLETTVHDGDVVKVFPVAELPQDIIELEGHVVRPGQYQFKPGMRVSDVLDYNAFLPQANLEYAEIERSIPPDLHPITISFNPGKALDGDASANIELACLDRIRVFRWDERNKQSVKIGGMVYEPNEYRLVAGMRVKNLIEAAGGLQKTAYLRAAELTRSHISQDGMTIEKIPLNLEKVMAGDPQQNIELQDYDRLTVRPIPDLDFGRSATIQGQVRFPGSYPIAKGEMLSSLIERAGGYTDQAYLKGAVFTRESAKEVQRDRLNKLISEIEQSMLSSAGQAASGALDTEEVKGQQAALTTNRELLTKLRATPVTGRVVVKLSDLAELKGSKNDFELEDEDALTIPATPGIVHVIGEVFNPTSLQYEKDRTVSYYLRKVGGMTKDADKKQVSVIKADGSVVSIEQGNRAKLVFWDSERNSWLFGGFMSMELEPGDTIIVPRKLDRFFWLKTTKDLTQIVFQIAVAAGIAFAI
jgi:protein involved in polysaccharide export with SLBB domain